MLQQKLIAKLSIKNKNLSFYLKNPNEKTFSLYPKTPTKVGGYIKNINIRKSMGPFSIPNRVLKEFNKIFAIRISHLFNLSLGSLTSS